MSTQETFLAEEHDIEDVDALLCSAQEPIGLSGKFCASENRSKRVEWFQEKITYNLLWVIRDGAGLAGVLILEQDEMERIVGIAYIVVVERLRGKRTIGPRLVQKAQTLASGSLKAEARNDNSQQLLERCGFQVQQERSCTGHPILIWSRS